MNISQTGRQEYLHPKQKELLDARFSKIAKLLEIDGKGDKQARVTFGHDRNLHRAEVSLNYMDHTVVGEHVDPDQFTALTAAIDKIERQMLKLREKRRDVKKSAPMPIQVEAPAREEKPVAAAAATNGKPKIYRVGPHPGKPVTAEEAMLIIENEPYLVFESASTGRPAVLIRRADRNFDLVEC